MHFFSRSSMTISAAIGESGEPIGKSDFCLKNIPWKLNAEFVEHVLIPFSNWYQGMFTCG